MVYPRIPGKYSGVYIPVSFSSKRSAREGRAAPIKEHSRADAVPGYTPGGEACFSFGACLTRTVQAFGLKLPFQQVGVSLTALLVEEGVDGVAECEL